MRASTDKTLDRFYFSGGQFINAQEEKGALVDPDHDNSPVANLDKISQLQLPEKESILGLVSETRHARRKKQDWIREQKERSKAIEDGNEQASLALRAEFKARMHPLTSEKQLQSFFYQAPSCKALAQRIADGEFVLTDGEFEKVCSKIENLGQIVNTNFSSSLNRLEKFEKDPLGFAIETKNLKLFKEKFTLVNFLENHSSIINALSEEPSPKKDKMLEYLLKQLDPLEYGLFTKILSPELLKRSNSNERLGQVLQGSLLEKIDKEGTSLDEHKIANLVIDLVENDCAETLAILVKHLSELNWKNITSQVTNVLKHPKENSSRLEVSAESLKILIEASTIPTREGYVKQSPFTDSCLADLLIIASKNNDDEIFDMIKPEFSFNEHGVRKNLHGRVFESARSQALINSAKNGNSKQLQFLLNLFEELDDREWSPHEKKNHKLLLKEDLESSRRDSLIAIAFDYAVCAGQDQSIKTILDHFDNDAIKKLLITGSKSARYKPRLDSMFGHKDDMPAALLYAIQEGRINSYRFLLDQLDSKDRDLMQKKIQSNINIGLIQAFKRHSHSKNSNEPLSEEDKDSVVTLALEQKIHLSKEAWQKFLGRLGGLSFRYLRRDPDSIEMMMQFLRALDDDDRKLCLDEATQNYEYSCLESIASYSVDLAREFVELTPESLKPRLWYAFSREIGRSDKAFSFYKNPEFLKDYLDLIKMSPPDSFLETDSWDERGHDYSYFSIKYRDFNSVLYGTDLGTINKFFSKNLWVDDEIGRKDFAKKLLNFYKLKNFPVDQNTKKAEEIALSTFERFPSKQQKELIRANNFLLVRNAFELSATELLKEYGKFFSEQEWQTMLKVGAAYKKIIPSLRVALALEGYTKRDNERIASQAAFALANLYEDSDKALDFVFNPGNRHNLSNSRQPIHDLVYNLEPCKHLTGWDKKKWQILIETYADNKPSTVDPQFAQIDIKELLKDAFTIQREYDILFKKGRIKNLSELSPEQLSALVKIEYDNAYKDLELAEFCSLLKLSEKDFNSALEVRNDIRTRLQALRGKDQIPEIGKEVKAVDGKNYSIIDGSSLGDDYKSYYLRKIDRMDPRILFVGKLASCCNSINDHTHDMAVAQASSVYGGCYVLAKKKVAGEINPSEDLIFAKTSVWKSKNGNLVFNSWESNKYMENPGLVFVRAAAEDILNKDSSISKISLGKNKYSWNLPFETITERPVDLATASGDSDYQYLVASRVSRNKIVLAGLGDDS